VRSYESKEEEIANTRSGEYVWKKGVTMAFAGEKFRGGKPTGILSIVVGVEKKMSLSRVAKRDLIPEKIAGIPTDVVEIPRIYALGTCTGGGGGGCPPHDEKYRPLIGGISAIEETSTACTLGLVVRDSTDHTLVALTNNHCAGLLYDVNYSVPDNGNSEVGGIVMLQPSPYDGGTSGDSYGVVKRAVAMQFGTASGQDNIVDCSISTTEIDDTDYIILELDDGPFPFGDKTMYSAGQEVLKAGRTTGNTPPPTTTVSSKSTVVNVDYSGGAGGDNNLAPFTDQIICTAASRFSQGGDSGSAIVAFINGRYRVIGLHFAGNANGTMGVCCPMEEIASLLNVEAWDGSVVTDYTEESAIYVNGRRYVRVGATTDPVTHSVGSSSSSSGSS